MSTISISLGKLAGSGGQWVSKDLWSCISGTRRKGIVMFTSSFNRFAEVVFKHITWKNRIKISHSHGLLPMSVTNDVPKTLPCFYDHNFKLCSCEPKIKHLSPPMPIIKPTNTSYNDCVCQ